MPDGVSPAESTSRRASSAAEVILRAVRDPGGLPTVGGALARLADLLERDSEAVHALADTILADAALTQRLLHLANTLPYRAGTAPVTTVTRAILLLGVNRVQAAAVSLLLLDRVVGRDNARRVYADFHQALVASSLASLLLGPAQGDDAEIACIAALMRNVGRMLLAVHAPQALAALRQGEDARSVVGCTLEELTAQLMREWNLPDRLVHATQPLPVRLDGTLAVVDPVRAAANFADAVAETLRTQGGAAREQALARLRERFAAALLIDEAALAAALEAAGERARQFEHGAGISGPPAASLTQVQQDPPQELASAPAVERDAVGRPANSIAVMLGGLADAAEALARGGECETVIQLVLESIYNGLGVARVALALRDPSGAIRVRTSFGQPPLAFVLPAQGAGDLFSAALSHTTDLHIGDVASEKVCGRLPSWFAQQCAKTRSFLLMPVASAGRPIGLLYADRTVTDPAGPSGEELNLLRALRSQLALALREAARQ